MIIDTLAKEGRTYTGLAGLDTARLKAMRNASLRACFNRLDDTHYRLAFEGRILDREYINDAAARNVNATWYSLDSMQGGIVWIAIGCNHRVDYSRLVPVALRKVRMLLVLGNDEQLRKQLGKAVPNIVACRTMAEALHHAYTYEAYDVKVLFSPACNDGTPTEALGEAFRYEVNEL